MHVSNPLHSLVAIFINVTGDIKVVWDKTDMGKLQSYRGILIVWLQIFVRQNWPSRVIPKFCVRKSKNIIVLEVF